MLCCQETDAVLLQLADTVLKCYRGLAGMRKLGSGGLAIPAVRGSIGMFGDARSVSPFISSGGYFLPLSQDAVPVRSYVTTRLLSMRPDQLG